VAIVVGVIAGIALCVKVVYPAMIKPLVDIGDEITALEDELYDYQEEAEQFDQALLDYKSLIERTASTDPEQVRNRLHATIIALAEKAKLSQPRVTARNARRDKRTGLQYLPIVITAEGALKETVEFLKSCYELPYVARFEDIKFSPLKKTSSKTKGSMSASDRIKLVATLEVAVVPRDSRAPIDVATLQQPESVVKYAGDSYAMIWDRAPFSEYVQAAPKRTPTPITPKETEPVKRPDPVKPVSASSSDKDARYKKVAMAISYGVDELLIVNERSKTQEYIATGSELDGGELVLVHPYGGVVRKERGDFFYEVGAMLSDAIPLAVANDYPGVQALARRLRDAPEADPAREGDDQEQADDGDVVADDQEVAAADDRAGDEDSPEPGDDARDSGSPPGHMSAGKDPAANRSDTRSQQGARAEAKDGRPSARSRKPTKRAAGNFRGSQMKRPRPSQKSPEKADRDAKGESKPDTGVEPERNESEDKDDQAD